jgi:ATP synthase protein I
MAGSGGGSPASALCAAQGITTALATAVTWAMSDSAAAMAALFGGLVVLIPTLYFAFRVGLRGNAATAKEALGALYQGELVKLLLTALMFLVGALLFGKHFAPLMLTCMACLAMNWVILAVARFD